MWHLMVFAFLALTSYTDAIPAEPFVIYSNLTNIYSLNLYTFNRTTILKGLEFVVPLGVDTVDQHIYFGEHTLSRIYRSNYDGTSKTLIIDGVKNVEGVAIDWIGRKLYWTTNKSATIEVSTLNGKYRKVLINTGLQKPRGMAVDPLAGYLFWSDRGASAAIERCALDGTNRTVLVQENITLPSGVTLDTAAQLVYWLDGRFDTISSMDYNGNNRKTIFDDRPPYVSQFHGFDLDISGDFIYFTDLSKNSIDKINKNTGVRIKTISVPTSKSTQGAMGLRVIDSSKQPSGTSNCGNTNGGCEQLCFHKVPTGSSCGCELRKKLADDGKKCEDPFKAEFLMFADADAGKIYQLQLDSFNVRPIPIPFDDKTNITRPVALEYDWIEDRVYWSDVTLQIICRAFRNGTGFEVLFNDIGIADGLTIDFAGRNLYWTSTTNDTVETSKLDGSFRKTLIRSNLDKPRDIIVDPISGYMYWTDWGNFPKIERAFMNGEERMDLVNHTLGRPNGLTIDHVYNKLYWADAGEDDIEVKDLETLERKVVLNRKILLFGFLFRGSTEVNHPYGLTLLHNYIYWTDWNTNSVYRADVNTGANVKLLMGNLGKPMDIHAYRAIPKPEKRLHYTFSFPNNKGSNFTCIRSRSCPVILDPPQCPPGYTEVRANQTCGLYCRDIVGYTRRCPCTDWMSCAVKERYLYGCPAYYSSFRVRECAQVVRPGRCPSSGTKGSQQSCNGDSECPTDEKCCNSKCTTPTSIALHPCRTNNGGCDQLCFAVPGGHKCGCENGFYYSETESKCKSLTEPTTTPKKTATTTPAPSDCSTVRCDYGATCKVVAGVAKCECDFSCSGSNSQVCGSDLITYDNKCQMEQAGCMAKKSITVLVSAPCDCDVNLSTDIFKKTSKMDCKFSGNSIKCDVICKPGYETAITGFLSLQCYDKQWLRKNNDEKYVRVSNANSAPRCYEPKKKNSQAPYCQKGSAVVQAKDLCVPCPPGSHSDSERKKCELCEVTTYQDLSGQSSCKACELQSTKTMTSTARGAEGCFVDYSSKSVKMTVEGDELELTKKKISEQIAEVLSGVCKGKKDCKSNGSSRRKRDSSQYEFTPKDVIVLHITALEDEQTEIELLLLDPTSTSPLPDSSFTTEELQSLILKIDKTKLSFQVKSVEGVPLRPNPGPHSDTTTGDDGNSTPYIGVGAAAAVVLIAVVVGVCFYNRRRKNRNTSPQASVQFNAGQDGNVVLGDRCSNAPVYEDIDAYRVGFNNQVYPHGIAPPPYYETSPIRKPAVTKSVSDANAHVYETPVGEENFGLSTTDKPNDGYVIVLPDESMYETTNAHSAPQSRSRQNEYHIPEIPGVQRSETAQSGYRLEPPPTLNNATREAASSSILTNVPLQPVEDGLCANPSGI